MGTVKLIAVYPLWCLYVKSLVYLLTIDACVTKVVPLRSIQAHLGERRYSSYSFLSSALEGGEWSASRPATFTRGKEPPIPVV
jgi:hypothetical protein